jgi:hypothetical protein
MTTIGSAVRVPVSQRRGCFASSLAAACLLLALGPGCDGAQPRDEANLEGSATFALTAPAGVPSVKVTFKGSRQVDRCVRVDGTTTTTLRGLPTGSVVVSAGAYTSNDCSGEPAWVTDDQTVQLGKGQPMTIQLVFHPNGVASITASYVDDVDDPNTPGDDRAGWVGCPTVGPCQGSCSGTITPNHPDAWICGRSTSPTTQYNCDGVEDCTQGQVCCLAGDFSSCRTECEPASHGSWLLCHTNQDCPTGQVCRGSGPQEPGLCQQH